MLFLYLDESGDLGFDFVNKKPSSFFVVAILEIEGQDDNRRLSKYVKIVLRRKSYKRAPLRELKGSLTPLKIKNYFYSKIKNLNFSLHTVILDKKKSYQSLWKDKERIYSHIAYLLLEKIKLDDRKTLIQLIIDRSKSKENIRAFDRFILLQLKGKIDPAVPLEISHRDSQTTYCLQAVDLFCWGIFRKYEAGDTPTLYGMTPLRIKLNMRIWWFYKIKMSVPSEFVSSGLIASKREAPRTTRNGLTAHL